MGPEAPSAGRTWAASWLREAVPGSDEIRQRSTGRVGEEERLSKADVKQQPRTCLAVVLKGKEGPDPQRPRGASQCILEAPKVGCRRKLFFSSALHRTTYLIGGGHPAPRRGTLPLPGASRRCNAQPQGPGTAEASRTTTTRPPYTPALAAPISYIRPPSPTC